MGINKKYDAEPAFLTSSVFGEDEVEYPVSYELWLVGVLSRPLLVVQGHELRLTLVELLPIILHTHTHTHTHTHAHKKKSTTHTHLPSPRSG